MASAEVWPLDVGGGKGWLKALKAGTLNLRGEKGCLETGTLESEEEEKEERERGAGDRHTGLPACSWGRKWLAAERHVLRYLWHCMLHQTLYKQGHWHRCCRRCHGVIGCHAL